MVADLVQAQYDELLAIARRFAEFAHYTHELDRAVNCAYRPLRQGSWIGHGVAAFSEDMDRNLLPAVIRLADAMSTADSTVRQAVTILQIAEQQAASLFRSNSALGPVLDTAAAPWADALMGGAPLGFVPLPYGGFGTDSGSWELTWGAAFSPLFPWATAPFAAGWSLSKLGPVKVWGRHSVEGKQLFLYFGGQSDTIASVHPWTGKGIPPKGLPKPNLRLDYGPINIGGKPAYLPNGTPVHVPENTNYFHWNKQGGGNLWKTIAGNRVNDHQLLTHSTTPKGNVLGTIRGSTLFRGAARVFGVVGVGMDVYSVATADDKLREGVRRGAAWGGAWGGAKLGAGAGALVGSIFPGPGTMIGGAVGGIIGGVSGYVGTYEYSGRLYDWLN